MSQTRMCDVLRFIKACDMGDLQTIKDELDFYLLLCQPKAEKSEKGDEMADTVRVYDDPRDPMFNTYSCDGEG